MSRCYHCGEVDAHCYLCRDCGKIYCILHKDPEIHDCNIVKEESVYPNPLNVDRDYGQMGASENGGEIRGRSDGSYAWYRRRGWVVSNSEMSNSSEEEDDEEKQKDKRYTEMIILMILMSVLFLIMQMVRRM